MEIAYFHYLCAPLYQPFERKKTLVLLKRVIPGLRRVSRGRGGELLPGSFKSHKKHFHPQVHRHGRTDLKDGRNARLFLTVWCGSRCELQLHDNGPRDCERATVASE